MNNGIKSKCVFWLAFIFLVFPVLAGFNIEKGLAADLSDPQEPAQKENLEGTSALQKKDYNTALSHFIKASILDNSEEKYFLDIGRTLYRHFDPKSAAVWIGKSLPEQKGLYKYYSYAGWAAIKDKENKKAVIWLEKAVILAKSENETALMAAFLNSLGSISFDLHQFDLATEYFYQATALQKDNTFYKQNWERAKHMIRRLTKRDNEIGFINYETGKFEKALPLFLKTYKIREKVFGAKHPDTLVSLNNLASLYQASGENDFALPFTLFTRMTLLGISFVTFNR